jgi:hypothetical protein
VLNKIQAVAVEGAVTAAPPVKLFLIVATALSKKKMKTLSLLRQKAIK